MNMDHSHVLKNATGFNNVLDNENVSTSKYYIRSSESPTPLLPLLDLRYKTRFVSKVQSQLPLKLSLKRYKLCLQWVRYDDVDSQLLN